MHVCFPNLINKCSEMLINCKRILQNLYIENCRNTADCLQQLKSKVNEVLESSIVKNIEDDFDNLRREISFYLNSDIKEFIQSDSSVDIVDIDSPIIFEADKSLNDDNEIRSTTINPNNLYKSVRFSEDVKVRSILIEDRKINRCMKRQGSRISICTPIGCKSFGIFNESKVKHIPRRAFFSSVFSNCKIFLFGGIERQSDNFGGYMNYMHSASSFCDSEISSYTLKSIDDTVFENRYGSKGVEPKYDEKNVQNVRKLNDGEILYNLLFNCSDISELQSILNGEIFLEKYIISDENLVFELSNNEWHKFCEIPTSLDNKKLNEYNGVAKDLCELSNEKCVIPCPRIGHSVCISKDLNLIYLYGGCDRNFVY